MEIRFKCECYDRTLVIEFPKRYNRLKEEIMKYLDQYYDEWIYMDGPYGTEIIQDMCLEAYMIDRLVDQYEMSLIWYVEED